MTVCHVLRLQDLTYKVEQTAQTVAYRAIVTAKVVPKFPHCLSCWWWPSLLHNAYAQRPPSPLLASRPVRPICVYQARQIPHFWWLAHSHLVFHNHGLLGHAFQGPDDASVLLAYQANLPGIIRTKWNVRIVKIVKTVVVVVKFIFIDARGCKKRLIRVAVYSICSFFFFP